MKGGDPTFVRLRVSDGAETSEIDVSYDYQWRDSVETPVGPARSTEELAADKLLAPRIDVLSS